MSARTRFSFLLSTAICSAALALAGCGDADNGASLTAEPVRSAAQDTPPPAVAPGLLGSITDVAAAQSRLAFVNPAALDDLGGPLPADEIAELVLGRAGASRLDRAADPAPTAVVQVGPATLLATGSGRAVVGGGSALRKQLTASAPAVSLITAETPSAVQSCLGDPAAEVIVGPSVMGRMSAVGASVVNTKDAPSGPKLLICAAPHFARDLHATEERLKARFPMGDAAPAQAPVVAEQEIGEREIVGAAVALDQIDPALLRDLISGGPALIKLAQG